MFSNLHGLHKPSAFCVTFIRFVNVFSFWKSAGSVRITFHEKYSYINTSEVIRTTGQLMLGLSFGPPNNPGKRDKGQATPRHPPRHPPRPLLSLVVAFARKTVPSVARVFGDVDMCTTSHPVNVSQGRLLVPLKYTLMPKTTKR